MNSKPLVSIVTPFLNAKRFFTEAIESVFGQTYPHWELLLVDDGSTDGSTQIALSYVDLHPGRVRYLSHPDQANRGTSASRNVGINNAKGEYIAFLDADDVWLAEKLEQQVAIMEAQPMVAMLYGSALWWYSWTEQPEDIRRDYRDFVEERGVIPNTLVVPPTLVTLFLRDGDAVPCPTTVMVRRDLLQQIGGFEQAFTGMYDDYVLYTKIGLQATVFAAGACWAKYRKHPDSLYATALQEGQEASARLVYLNWLEHYLVEQGFKESELWYQLQQMLQPYRHPTAPVEIDHVSIAPPDTERLWGSYLDQPQTGSQSDGRLIEIAGWVLPRSGPAVAVEVVHAGVVIKRVPLAMRRPDLANGFPHVPYAEQGGFRTHISGVGMTALILVVQAVLDDQQRVPLGTVHTRRRWREQDCTTGAALVSVVIPCYNQARFLAEAIESVLAQTYPHFEIIVVDDGATDNTAAVALRYPSVYYIRQANAGLSAARNTGLRHSKGSYLVFLDADDRLLPQALEVGLAGFNKHPESAFVAGQCRYIGDDGESLVTPQQRHVEHDHYLALLQECFIWVPAAVMYQRIMLELFVGFDRTVNASADYDLYLRIARTLPIHCHNQVIVEYRQHSASMNRNAALMLTATLKALHGQWMFIKGNTHYQEAYKTGVKLGQEYYGTQLLEEIQAQLSVHNWRSVLASLGVLARYSPNNLVDGLHSLVSQLRREARMHNLLHNASRARRSANTLPISHYVCPVCKGAFIRSINRVECTTCGLQFPQSRNDCVDLLPVSLLKDQLLQWESRQHEMEHWYKELLANPDEAADSFKWDYNPYAAHLSTLSGTILDLGGGIGITRHYLPQHTQYTVIDPSFTWLDIDWSAITCHFPCLQTKPHFIRGIGEYLPFPTHSFDTVLAFWSLNHVTDPARVLHEIGRVLRPGGRFIAALEDMLPTEEDLTDPLFPIQSVFRINEDNDLDRSSILDHELIMQKDHIHFHEDDLQRWIHGSFSVTWRKWVHHYLSFEFVKV